MSDVFTGFPADAVATLGVLKGLYDPTQIKYGCTCGECIQGVLSPRMRFALLCQAKMVHECLNMDIDNGPKWCDLYTHTITHVAPVIQEEFKIVRSLRQGFANLFDYIAACLQSDKVPTHVNVLKEWDDDEEPPHTKIVSNLESQLPYFGIRSIIVSRLLSHYYTVEPSLTADHLQFLERGGRIDDALLTVFELARNQDDMAGDGQHDAVFQTDIERLPECRNDHEYGFVSLHCGVEVLEDT